MDQAIGADNMRFNLGDKVEVKATGENGEVMEINFRRVITPWTDKTEEKYLIKFKHRVYASYYSVDDIKDWLEIDEEAKEVIDKLVIDSHLDNRNFEALRELTQRVGD